MASLHVVIGRIGVRKGSLYKEIKQNGHPICGDGARCTSTAMQSTGKSRKNGIAPFCLEDIDFTVLEAPKQAKIPHANY